MPAPRTPAQLTGVLPFLLPYMDLNDIYDGLDADMNAGGTVKYGGISVTDINKASSGAWWWTRGR